MFTAIKTFFNHCKDTVQRLWSFLTTKPVGATETQAVTAQIFGILTASSLVVVSMLVIMLLIPHILFPVLGWMMNVSTYVVFNGAYMMNWIMGSALIAGASFLGFVLARWWGRAYNKQTEPTVAV